MTEVLGSDDPDQAYHAANTPTRRRSPLRTSGVTWRPTSTDRLLTGQESQQENVPRYENRRPIEVSMCRAERLKSEGANAGWINA